MKTRFRTLAIMATGAVLTAWLAAGCYSSGGSPRVYGSVGVGTGYYGGYGGGYYDPWYGRPYPPYGSRPPGMRPPPSSGPPRPMNPIARPPSPGRMPSMGGGRMPSIPSMPRPGRF
jgi:hypothetical protein